MCIKYLNVFVFLLGTQYTNSFVPFVHTITQYKRLTVLEKGLKSILTIEMTLFTKKFM